MAARAPSPPPAASGLGLVGRVLAWAALAVLALVVVFAAVVVWLNTTPGRAFVARQLSTYTLASGLRFEVGRIDGSLFGHLTVRDLRAVDARGVYATVPVIDVRWRPGEVVSKRLSIATLNVPEVSVLRVPLIKPTSGPLLPNFDIRVDRFTVGRIDLSPAVTGRAEQLRVVGRTEIERGRALVNVDAVALSAPDQLHLHLDAEPDANRFELAAVLDTPKGGVVDKLSGLGRALTVTAGGRGTYADWRGSARVAVDGGSVADLALRAAAGTYRLTGAVTAGGLLPTSAARLLAPALQVDVTARVVPGGAMVNARAVSDALQVSALGRAGTDAAGLEGFTVDLALPRPELAYHGLAGRNVRARMVLDGPVRTPAVRYTVRADTLAFNTTGLTGLALDGQTRVPLTGPVPLPFTLSAATVTGVPQAAGELVRGLRASGTLLVSAKQVTADRIAFRSDRLTGTATAAYTFATGQYLAAVNGAVSRYALQGIGVADVTLQSRIVPSARGELTLRAEVAANAVRVDNAGALSFLGGLPRVRASIERTPAGLILLSNVGLTAPKLTIAGGRGMYDPKGGIRFDAAGRSVAYGPVALSVTGTVARPTATVRLASPGLGIGLTNVVATATPAGSGYAIAATGTTPQGPLTAKVRVALGGGPLAVDIDQVTLAGLSAHGRVTATAAGPYTGRLAVDGAGVSGVVNLVAAGRVQGADGELTLVNARLPLSPPVTVGHGQVRFHALLTPGAPSLQGRADLAGVRRDTLTLSSAVVSVDTRAGQGRAGAVLTGNAGQDFTARLGVAFTPGHYRVALDGTLSRVAFRLAAPAEVTAVAGGYRLAPATLLLPKGRLDLSGEQGDAGIAIDARLNGLDLGIAALINPNLRLGGTATGHVQLRLPGGGALPVVRADVAVAGLTRIGIGGASVPVDLAATAVLGDAGANADAVIRRQGTVIGRLQAHVLPGAGAGRERVMNGALTGGVRFNGPAEALWALSGLSGSDVRGAVAVGADFGGKPAAPTVNGVARAAALRYENLTYGTVLDKIVLDSRFTGSRFELTSLTARAGTGSLSASGTAAIDPVRGFPFDFQATLKSAVLANSQALSATVSGSVRAVSTGPDAKVTGDLTVERARYRIQRADTAPVAVLAVRHKGAPPPPPVNPRTSGPSKIALDVRAKADGMILVEGLGLESEWRARVRARGTLTTPELTGTADIVRGTYAFSGKSFDITRGHVALDGSYPPSPTVDIVATATLPEITATITIGGSATKPDITFASTPALPQDEILARLLFGESVTQLSPTEALQLASALNGLRGGGTGLDPIGRLGKIAGLDRLRIIGADKTTGRGTALAFGKYIGRKIYVEVTTDAQGNAATSVQYSLSRVFSVLAQVGAIGQNSANLRYSRDY